MPCEYVTAFQVLRKLFHSPILMYTLCCVKMSVQFHSYSYATLQMKGILLTHPGSYCDRFVRGGW